MPFPATLLDPPHVTVPNRQASAEEETHIAQIIAHFNAPGYVLPVTEADPHNANLAAEEKLAPLSEREMMYLSRETILRFLSATRTGPEATIDRLERAIRWRRSVRIDDFEALAKENYEEAAMAKNLVFGFAPNGSPIMYCFPHRNSRDCTAGRKLVHALFMLERAVDLMSDGVTQVLVVFNFGGKRKGPQTSVAAARHTLHILGEYYPELLGHAIIQDMPYLIRGFVAIMWPFVDPHTKSKIKFYSGEEAVAAGEVEGKTFLKECGGSLNLKPDVSAYWPILMKTCLARRAEHERLWRALGEPQVGREERLFKVARPGATEL